MRIEVFEDASWSPSTLVLEIGGSQSVHINSGDLENGNPAKGLEGYAGYGPGDWRLRLETTLNVEALSYIRTPDGLLTAMHDVVPSSGRYLRVPVFNPARNTRQRSLLRLVNPTATDREVTIVGVDDQGRTPGGGVRFVLDAQEARTLTAVQLESGDHDLEGKLGVGSGKWRLFVRPADGLIAASLLESPGGYLSNLSTTTLAIDSSPPSIGPETGFGPPRIIDPQTNPSRTKLADLDGDGNPDLLIASNSAPGSEGRIVWYENFGGGEFSSARTILVDKHVHQLGSADLDGDGDLDVFYTMDSNPQFAWVENLGNGQFGRPSALLPPPRGVSPFVVASDVDGDGDTDFFLGWDSENSIDWIENLGKGRFSEPQAINDDIRQAYALTVSDLNGDGSQDILIGSPDGDGVSWIENLGRGNFASPRRITTHPYSAVFTADLDGDGDLDLITATRVFGIHDRGTFAWHENLGGAVFSKQRLIDSRTFNIREVSAVDLDGDGDLDLAVYAEGLTGTLAWYENFGDAHFSTARIIEEHPTQLGAFVFADLNADNKVDLITPHDHGLVWYDNLGLVSAPTEAPTEIKAVAEVGKAWVTWNLIPRGGDGGSPVVEYRATATPQRYGESRSCTTGTTRGCTILHLNPDKTYDVNVVALNRAGVGPSSGVVAVTPLANPSTNLEFGGSQTAPVDAADLSSSHAEVGDLDGDGDADLLVAGKNLELAWYESANGAYATRRVIHRLPWPFRPFAADIDLDGRMDVLVAATRRDQLFLFRNLGDGAFAPPVSIAVAGDWVGLLQAADIDGDGDMDILTTVGSGSGLAWHENTDGAFLASNAHPIPIYAESIWGASASDIDGDGDMDLAYGAKASGSIIWRENRGGGRYGSPQTIVEDAPRFFELQDMDGDGDQDLFATSEAKDGNWTVAWHQNLGKGAFVGPRVIAQLDSRVGYRTRARMVDLDGDGDRDVLYASTPYHTLFWGVRWAENLGGGSFSWGRFIGEFERVSLLAAADANGDGKPDAVVASGSQGKLGWFENKGLVTAPLGAPRNVRIVSGVDQLWITWDPLAETDWGGAAVTGYEVTVTLADGTWVGGCKTIEATGCTVVDLASEQNYAVSVTATNRKGTGPASTPIPATPIKDPEAEFPLSFGEQRIITTEAHATWAIASADLDADGDVDVVSASKGYGSTSDETKTPKIAWYENLGGGTFSELLVVTTEIREPEWILAADLTSDGLPDLTTNSRRDAYVAWMENRSGGRFSAPQSIVSDVYVNSGLAVADLDSDGGIDVLSDSDRSNQIVWFKNLGSGRFADAESIVDTDDVISAFHAEDFDGDGDPDVLYKKQWAQVLAWRENRGAGAFSGERRIAAGVDGSGVLDAADLDGDGDLDALAMVPHNTTPGAIAWYENLGEGAFSGQRIVGLVWDRTLESMFPIDLDGDGDVDVLSASWSNRVAWFENLGGGLFAKEREIGQGGWDSSTVFAADLDGDGRPDVLSGDRDGGVVGWYRNLGRTVPAAESSSINRAEFDHQP